MVDLTPTTHPPHPPTAQRLYTDYGLETKAYLDIREVAGGLGLVHCRRRALSWMAKEFLGVEMDKEQQLSDWQDKELTKEQIEYSAIDSWVASSIVEVMFRRYRSQVGQVSSSLDCKALDINLLACCLYVVVRNVVSQGELGLNLLCMSTGQRHNGVLY